MSISPSQLCSAVSPVAYAVFRSLYSSTFILTAGQSLIYPEDEEFKNSVGLWFAAFDFTNSGNSMPFFVIIDQADDFKVTGDMLDKSGSIN